jgi:hypothetical protein
MRLPSEFSLLGVVSGTDVALLHSIQTGKLMCINLMTGGVSHQMQGNFWILSQSDFDYDTSRDLATVEFRMSDVEVLEHPRHVVFDLTRMYYMSTNARCRVFRIQVYEISCREEAPGLHQLWNETVEAGIEEADFDILTDGNILALIRTDDKLHVRAWNLHTQIAVEYPLEAVRMFLYAYRPPD